ncbi:unnamed protein product [Urochloa humidicola]
MAVGRGAWPVRMRSLRGRWRRWGSSCPLALWLYAAFLRSARPLLRRVGPRLGLPTAAAGLDLVLVGCSPDKLAAVAAAGDVVADKVDALGELIRDLDVGVLVSNAGACYPYARYFHELDEALRSIVLCSLIRSTSRP